MDAMVENGADVEVVEDFEVDAPVLEVGS